MYKLRLHLLLITTERKKQEFHCFYSWRKLLLSLQQCARHFDLSQFAFRKRWINRVQWCKMLISTVHCKMAPLRRQNCHSVDEALIKFLLYCVCIYCIFTVFVFTAYCTSWVEIYISHFNFNTFISILQVNQDKINVWFSHGLSITLAVHINQLYYSRRKTELPHHLD